MNTFSGKINFVVLLVKFVVDEISLLYVSGTTIDWKEELFGSQFTVENPNSTSGCGCGESFSM